MHSRGRCGRIALECPIRLPLCHVLYTTSYTRFQGVRIARISTVSSVYSYKTVMAGVWIHTWPSCLGTQIWAPRPSVYPISGVCARSHVVNPSQASRNPTFCTSLCELRYCCVPLEVLSPLLTIRGEGATRPPHRS
jgi:hypothetical protein